jgi:hypothetical protein
MMCNGTTNSGPDLHNLKNVLDQAAGNADYTVITRRDAGDAVVMS